MMRLASGARRSLSAAGVIARRPFPGYCRADGGARGVDWHPEDFTRMARMGSAGWGEKKLVMPAGPVPERYHDLLASTALGYLATISANGKPQVNPVWFLADAHYLWLSIKPETAKYRNLRANPAVALAIGDPARSERYLELRGEVIAFELFNTLAWVNQLARKYTGADFTGGRDGEHRYKVTIRIDAWTAQG